MSENNLVNCGFLFPIVNYIIAGFMFIITCAANILFSYVIKIMHSTHLETKLQFFQKHYLILLYNICRILKLLLNFTRCVRIAELRLSNKQKLYPRHGKPALYR